MMNRYITALLVVLTTTGIEAQVYQSAIKAARGGEVALEELCRHSAFQGREAELRSFFKASKSGQECDDHELTRVSWGMQGNLIASITFLATRQVVSEKSRGALLKPAHITCIQIRAPSF